MKKLYLLSICILFQLNVNSQSTTNLNLSGVDALINSNGVLFQDITNNSAAYEVPKGSNSFSIFSSSFWISSLSQKNSIPNISGVYDRFGNDFLFNIGPVDIINQTADTSAIFNRLWKVRKSDIDNHIQSWNSPNYVTPNSILEWPGNGNNNNAQNLAAYADLDNDNIYEPLNGEYPIIKGDEAVFLMLNDYRPEDSLTVPVSPSRDSVISYFTSLNLEMHIMLYVYSSNIVSVNNSVFCNVKLFNRANSSQGDHNDLHFSVYADFDLGQPMDDYVGTDSTRNMFYAYNGDLFDEDFQGQTGYGNKLAAQGVKFLDNRIEHAIYYNVGGGLNGDPGLPIHIANYQRGKWQDGRDVFFGGNGLNEVCVDTTISTKMMYSGNPTLINDTTQWTEENPCASLPQSQAANSPGDRRMIGGPNITEQFLHGDMMEINFAYVFAQDKDTSTRISDPLNDLFTAADSVQNFYDNVVTNIENPKIKEVMFNIYPNPAQSILNIETEATNYEIAIIDIRGVTVYEDKNKSMLNLEHLARGVYFAQIKTSNSIKTKKLILSK
jgi:hypothetical protein